MTGQRRRGRLLFVVALALFAVVTSIASASATNINGPVAVNGHNLHLECAGAGSWSPTVVFESGLGNAADEWNGVVEQLAGLKLRWCRYDRLGLGDSDVPEATLTRTVAEVAAEKRSLLAAAGVKGPYILVGHSIAGLIDRYYAKVYPGQVAGAVMIDTAPDDWNLYRGSGAFHQDTFSETPNIELSVAAASRSLRSSDRLGNRPLVVIEADSTMSVAPAAYWDKRQRALARISRNSIFFVAAGTDHGIPEEAPKLIAKSIQLVVTSARRHKHLPACKAAKLAGARC